MSERRARSARPPGRPAESERPGARDGLLDAASRLYAHRAFGEVSLRRIASEAGVTPAMVHYYFGDKEGLYEAMLERAFGRLLEQVRRVASEEPARHATGETDAVLGRLLRVVTSTLAAEPWIPALMVREVLAEGGRFRERFIAAYASQMAELLPGLIRRESEAGRFRDDLDPRLAFLSFMGMTVFPFVARPVVERVLGLAYDEEFLRRFREHTERMFLEGARA